MIELIVLNEKEYVEDLLSERRKSYKFEDLVRIARYCMDSGLSRKEASNRIEELLQPCGWSWEATKRTVSQAVYKAGRIHSVNVGSIPVTKKELEVIESIRSKQAQRLAFAILCLSKYYNAVYDSQQGWVHLPSSRLMTFANVSVSHDRKMKMFNDLYTEGYIEISHKIASCGIRCRFLDLEDDPIVKITDFRNLGYQYLAMPGHSRDDFIKCAVCGKIVRANPGRKDARGRKQKYCKTCLKIVQDQQKRESRQRLRNRHV